MSLYSIRDPSVFVPIPQIFHSLEKDGPFTNCLLCNRALFGANTSDDIPTYYIERIFRGDEPIVEYALCMNCDGEVRNEISKGSIAKIEMFFDEHVDMEQRVATVNEGPNPRAIESWLSACVVTKEKFSDCQEKQILAVCHGDQLALPTTMMLSGTAISMVVHSCPKKTREWLGEFTSTNFGMPPEFCDNPDVYPVIL